MKSRFILGALTSLALVTAGAVTAKDVKPVETTSTQGAVIGLGAAGISTGVLVTIAIATAAIAATAGDSNNTQ